MLVEFAILPNNDEHLQDVQQEWEEWKALRENRQVSGASLLVVHAYGNYDDKVFDRWIEVDRSGGGVLFISTSPSGVLSNLNQQLANRQQNVPWPQRWRVLATPVSGIHAGPELRARFGRFLRSCAGLHPGEAIPWDELYSLTVGENVLSIYLWCLAQPTLSRKGVTVPDDLSTIVNEAWKEIVRLNLERRIALPATRAEFNKCLELNHEACELFTNWFKNVLLPGLELARG